MIESMNVRGLVRYETDKSVRYAEITDEAILNYHSKESSDVVKDVD